jgi:hypothetical protein
MSASLAAIFEKVKQQIKNEVNGKVQKYESQQS